MVRPDANENHSVGSLKTRLVCGISRKFIWGVAPGLRHLPQVYLGGRELEEPRGRSALQKRGAITVGQPRCAGRSIPTSTVQNVINWGVPENFVTSRPSPVADGAAGGRAAVHEAATSLAVADAAAAARAGTAPDDAARADAARADAAVDVDFPVELSGVVYIGHMLGEGEHLRAAGRRVDRCTKPDGGD